MSARHSITPSLSSQPEVCPHQAVDLFLNPLILSLEIYDLYLLANASFPETKWRPVTPAIASVFGKPAFCSWRWVTCTSGAVRLWGVQRTSDGGAEGGASGSDPRGRPSD